ncbi:MAG: c-type cytochrome [Rhodospirillales bacterium]
MAAGRRTARPGPSWSLRPAAVVAAVGVAAAAFLAPMSASAEPPDPARGKYLFDAAGCAACHTDKKSKGRPLAGGRRLKTPFGVFVSPNISPDPRQGIGGWSDADFIRALRLGVAPDGGHYFPVFPYPSYTGITDRDLLDIKAHIFTLEPVARPNEPHDANPPFGWRFLLGPWKWLFFTPGPFRPDPGQDDQWNRGAYLVRALGHCGECHTPRNALGAARDDMALAGTAAGPEGGVIPNITPDRETGIGKWSDGDMLALLKLGMRPNADFVGDLMGEVVDGTTSRLGDADRRAIIRYLRAVAPVRHRVEAPKNKEKKNEKKPPRDGR